MHPDKMQLPFFSSLAAVLPKWKADKNGVQGHQEKDSKTLATDFQRGLSDKYAHIVKSSLVVHHNMGV